MNLAGAMAAQGSHVLDGAVAFVLLEAVLRVQPVAFFHELVSMHLSTDAFVNVHLVDLYLYCDLIQWFYGLPGRNQQERVVLEVLGRLT